MSIQYRIRSRWQWALLHRRQTLDTWAYRYMPEPGAMFPRRLGWRGWTALAYLDGTSARRLAAHRWFAWTLLPGDQVHDYLRMLDGVVVRVPRPGQAEVVWATAEDLYRWPGCLEGASAVQDFCRWLTPYSNGRPVLRRESLPAVRLAPGWRYSRL